MATLKSRYNKYKVRLEFLFCHNMNYLFPSIRINRESLQIPKNIILADPDFYMAGEIDGIIGVGVFYKLLCMGQSVPKNHPDAVLQKTQLGWIVAVKIYVAPLSTRHTREGDLALRDDLIKLLREEDFNLRKY